MMQTVIFDKSDRNVINIDDVKEDGSKIYCYVTENRFLFLHHPGNVQLGRSQTSRYYWININLSLHSSAGGIAGFSTFTEAMKAIGYDYGSSNYKLMIFDSECEVLEYAKKM